MSERHPKRGRSEVVRRVLAAAHKSIDPRPEAARELESMRRAAGKSQAELADALGIARSTVATLEQGRRSIDARFARRAAEALGAQPEPLLSAIERSADRGRAVGQRLAPPIPTRGRKLCRPPALRARSWLPVKA